MNRLKLQIVMAATALAMVATASAQVNYLDDPKYGTTPDERKENVYILNFFNDTYNNNDYDAAIKHMKHLLDKCPKASENIYVNGINIYKNKIARATSLAQKGELIDSLMLLYDLRIANFGHHATRGKGYLMSNKAREYLTYKPSDMDGVHSMFKAAIEENGDQIDPDFLNIYFQMLTEDYKADNIEVDALLNEYDRLLPIFDMDVTPERAEAKKTFEALFISSGAANCENLEKLFKPRIEATPTDPELLEKAVALMTRGGCKGDFYLNVAEKFHSVKPSSSTAMTLAAGFEEKKEFVKALKYLNEAVATESDPVMKSNLCVRIAGNELGAGNARSAAEFAKQALSINPNNGYAQMILAQAYAVGVSNSCSGFDRQSAFWLVYDILSEARRAMGNDSEQIGTIDNQLATYRANFPSKEECFFRGLSNGAAYTVNCGWVSGRTTVREGR